MKISEILHEGKNTPTIVVDVQPAYTSNETHMVMELMEFLNNQTGPILFLINAEQEGLTDDSKHDCIEYWIEHGLSEDTLNRATIYDKGYGYFRGWMDSGADSSTMIKTIRAMYQEGYTDFRQFDEEEMEALLGNDFEDYMRHESFGVEWISVKLLKQHSGYICGGGRHECLREVQLLMNAFNIKYKEISKFIYG